MAAPYVETAVAFGHACGLPRKWLHELFRFARRPSERYTVDASPGPAARPMAGFVEFGCSQLRQTDRPWSERQLVAGTRAYLRGRGRRLRARGSTG